MLDRGNNRGGKQVPYLRNQNVQWGRFDLSDVSEMELLDDELDRFEVRTGDLLVCEGGEIGRCAIWQGRLEHIAYQKALHRIRPGPDLDSRFLSHALKKLSLDGTLARYATGSTIKHLPQVALRHVTLSLPPIDEQSRIVAVLEDQLSRLSAATRYLATARARSARLSEANLRRIDQMSTEEIPLQDLLAQLLSNGRSVPDGSGAPVLRLSALKGDTVDTTAAKLGSWTALEAAPFAIRQGDLLLARGNGSLHLVGRAAMVVGEPALVAYPDTMIRVRPDHRLIDPRLLLALWNGPHVRRQIEVAVRTTAGIYKINQKQLLGIRLRVPPRQHQKAILTELDEMEGARQRLQGGLDQASRGGIALRTALLTTAFAGGL